MRAFIGLILCLVCVSADATLQGRLPATPGGSDYQAYYDDVLDITWLADANLAGTNHFGVALINGSGGMSWDTANSWIAAMNIANYLGVNDWRLPALTDTGTPGCDFAYTSTDCGYNVDLSTGEIAHLYYGTLGNTGYYDTMGTQTGCVPCLTQTNPFSNIQLANYWYGTEYGPNTLGAWVFGTPWGQQSSEFKTQTAFKAWPVRPGDIDPPTPLSVIYSRTPSPLVSGSPSDANAVPPQYSAEVFSLSAAATVTSVTWRGIYFPTSTPEVPDDFTIIFYADSGGLPGSQLAAFSIGVPDSRVDTGITSGSGPEKVVYEYTQDLGAGVNLPSGVDLFIAIFNNTAGETNDTWEWSVGNPGAGFGGAQSNGDLNSWFATIAPNYFILEGPDPNPPGPPIARVLNLNYDGDVIETRYINSNALIASDPSDILATTSTGNGPCSMSLSATGDTVIVGTCLDGMLHTYSTIISVSQPLPPIGPALPSATTPNALVQTNTHLIVCNDNGEAREYLKDETGAPVLPGVLNTEITCDTPTPMVSTPATALAVPPTVTNSFVYVAHKGPDITRLSINAATGELSNATVDTMVNGENNSNGKVGGAVVPSTSYVYVGTHTTTIPQVIYGLQLDPQTGALDNLQPGPLATTRESISIAVQPKGGFLYAGHFNETVPLNPEMSAYSIDSSTGVLSPLGSPFAVPVAPEAIVFDPSGTYAYVCGHDDSGTGYIQPYSADVLPITGAPSGTLTLAGTPQQPGCSNYGIVIVPSGKFLYVVDGTITTFKIVASSGALSQMQSLPDIGAVDVVVNSPYETYAYVLRSDNNVSAYTIDATTGVLSEILGGPYATAAGTPRGLVVDASGSYLYALTDSSTNFISAYKIETDGTLTAVTGSPYTIAGPHAQLILINR